MILNHHDALTFVVRNFNMTESIAPRPMEESDRDRLFHVLLLTEERERSDGSIHYAQGFRPGHDDQAAAHVPLPRITMSKSSPLARISIMPETQHRPQDCALRAAWARCIGGRWGPVKPKRAENPLFFAALWIGPGRTQKPPQIPADATMDRRAAEGRH